MPEYIERKARYIDAYSLGDKVFESKKNNPHLIDVVARNHNCEHEHFLKLIADEPTADVVEVVRCKDCQYGRGNADGINLKVPFMYFCTYDDFSYNGEDHFCGYGKRKEGAEE